MADHQNHQRRTAKAYRHRSNNRGFRPDWNANQNQIRWGTNGVNVDPEFKREYKTFASSMDMYWKKCWQNLLSYSRLNTTRSREGDGLQRQLLAVATQQGELLCPNNNIHGY